MPGETNLLIPILTDAAPAPQGHYSQAIAVNGLIFVAAQLPIAPDGSIPETIEAQCDVVLDNVAAILEAAGSGLDRLVSVSIYVTDIANWPRVNSGYAARLGEHRPARGVFVSPQLHLGAGIAIQAIGAAR